MVHHHSSDVRNEIKKFILKDITALAKGLREGLQDVKPDDESNEEQTRAKHQNMENLMELNLRLWSYTSAGCVVDDGTWLALSPQWEDVMQAQGYVCGMPNVLSCAHAPCGHLPKARSARSSRARMGP